jgi:hypothetical protein
MPSLSCITNIFAAGNFGSDSGTVIVPTDSTPFSSTDPRTLSPALLTNANTFYGPTITLTNLTLLPPLLTETNTFYSPTIANTNVLTPSLFTNTNTFFSPTVLANVPTTWDSGSSASVTLSNGNLTATNSGTNGTNQGAHAPTTVGKTSGKHYFEFTLTTKNLGNNVGAGIGTTASTYTNMGNSATTGDEIYYSGNIWANGSNTGTSLGARAQGDVIAVAVDMGNLKIWFKVVSGTPGNWNNSGTANPATNVGGITIPSGTMIPFVTFGGTNGNVNNAITANFGATSFTGTVPSGFASGWLS